MEYLKILTTLHQTLAHATLHTIVTY